MRGSEADCKMTLCILDKADFCYSRIHGNILSQKMFPGWFVWGFFPWKCSMLKLYILLLLLYRWNLQKRRSVNFCLSSLLGKLFLKVDKLLLWNLFEQSRTAMEAGERMRIRLCGWKPTWWSVPLAPFWVMIKVTLTHADTDCSFSCMSCLLTVLSDGSFGDYLACDCWSSYRSLSFRNTF